jgi:hypothetical protein
LDRIESQFVGQRRLSSERVLDAIPAERGWLAFAAPRATQALAK